MNMLKTRTWSKLAIVLRMAVITWALMAQTMYARGAAQAEGESTLSSDICDASPTLDQCVEPPTEPPDCGGEVTVRVRLHHILSHHAHHLKQVYRYMQNNLCITPEAPASDADFEGIQTAEALF